METGHHPNLRWVGLASLIAFGLLLAATDLLARPRAPSGGSPSPSSSPLAITASSTQPKITWSQPSLNLTLSPGEHASRDLTFSSSLDLANVVLEAVPEIAGFVSLQPNSFSAVPAGQPQSVHLSFAIPAGTALGTYDGTVHIKVGSRTLPETLKVSLNVSQRYSDPAGRFSFELPAGWSISGTPDGLSLTSPERTAFLQAPDEVDTPPEISISVLPNPTGLSPAAFATSYDQGWFTNYVSSAATTVAGRPAQRFSDVGAPVGHAPFEAVFVSDGSFVVIFTLNDYETNQSSTQEAILNQLLSTLRF